MTGGGKKKQRRGQFKLPYAGTPKKGYAVRQVPRGEVLVREGVRVFFSARFEQRRKELRLTHAAIAKQLDLSREAVSQWATGGLPRPDRWDDVARVLEMGRDELFSGRQQTEEISMSVSDFALLRKIRDLSPEKRKVLDGIIEVLRRNDEEGDGGQRPMVRA
jgi:transcriptional regulator with XRE-family HTH domain